MVLMEHRFYGKSLPFGANESYKPRADRLGLLSVDQALHDYNAILASIRTEYSSWDSALVTFGASLAGSMAAWMRIRFPAMVDAAWASSAPLRGYDGTGVSPYAFRQRVTTNYELLAPGCSPLVQRGFSALEAATTDSVAAAFRVCKPVHEASSIKQAVRAEALDILVLCGCCCRS